MTITPTTLLGLPIITTGTESGAWGDEVNNGLTWYMDAAIAGAQTISGSQTAVTLSITSGTSSVTNLAQVGAGSTGSSQYQIINCTGNPASTLTITAPASSKTYIIINATSTSQSVKIVGAGPTAGVTIASGEKALVAWSGSDFVKVNSNVSYMTGTLPVANGGTGVTTSTGSGNNVLSTSPTLVTPILGTPTSVTLTNATGLPLTTGVTGTLPVANGGTGLTSYTANGVLYASGTGTIATGANFTYDSNGNLLVGTSSYTGIDTGSQRITVQGIAAGNGGTLGLISDSLGRNIVLTDSSKTQVAVYSLSNTTATIGTNTSIPLTFNTVATERMRLDSSGNLGLGVTPSAWSGYGLPVLQLPTNGTIVSSGDGNYLGANWYYTGGAFKYTTTNPATYMQQIGGAFKWFNAPSGTAGSAISFTQAMTLDASGNVQLGTTTNYGSSRLTVVGSNGTYIRVSDSVNTAWRGYTFGVLDNINYAHMIFNANSGELQIQSGPNSGYGGLTTFYTAGTERARIDTSGNLLVGTTSASATVVGARIITSTTTPQISVAVSTTSNNYLLYNTTAGAYRFFVSDAGQINATSTSITAISDQSLKENVRDLETGLNEVMALKPRRFDWKEETKIGLTNVAGFIAQEVEQVLPELVQDYQYNDNEIKKSLKMGDILPTLVKAIQEQQALITQLQQRLAAAGIA